VIHAKSEPLETGSIPGPEDITRLELANGITILARPNPHSPSVEITGYLRGGGIFDTDEKLGLAGFVASGLMRGTVNRNFQQIYDELESVGATMGFGGGTHTVGFHGRALAEDFDLLMGILSDALRSPSFPTNQIERLRAQILTGLALRSQNTGDMAALTFNEMAYPNHPYCRPDEGHPDTILSINQNDLVAFHRRHYGPRGLVIAIVGGIDPQEAVGRVSASLGDWSNADQPDAPPLPDLPPISELVTRRVDIPGKSQSDLLIGVPGPPRLNPHFLAAAVGNNIFGRFGLMGRIGESVREKAGLAYYAYSSLSGGIGPGPWVVSAGVNPTNEDKATELIRTEIRNLVTELVTDDELSDSQANFIGRLPISLESNAGVAGALLNLERYQLGLDYYHRYPELIRAVTREQVLAVAANHLHPDRLAIAAAGPPITTA
jgi:zinc protease